MLLEDVLLAVAGGIVALVFGWPVLRLLKAASQRRRDPLAEANERLRIARLEAEVARVNRETEKLYETMYEDTLLHDRAASGSTVARTEEQQGTRQEERQPLERPFEKGKHHGQG